MLATDFFRQNACPPAEVLVAYSSGLLPDEHLAPAAEHLTACRACLETMRRLEGIEDPLIADLRRFVPEELPTLEPKGVAGFSVLVDPGDRGFVTTIVLEPETGGPVADLVLPRAFAGYELLEELGRGGMGTVYKARQSALDRLVALKVITAGTAAGPDSRARFRVEAKAVARLKHPQVVQIYEFGEEKGQPYFSMEIVEGGSLKDRLGGRQQPERESAELVRAVALGIDAAHRQHIIHRDLKPGNVMLDRDGTPKVGDFGLAKLLDAEHSQTLTDAIMGTPAYMAPEQVSGPCSVGPAVDIYGLGAILFEMLTGRPPFRGASRMDTLDQVRHLLPPALTRLRPGIAPDLEAVCSKCLEKDPLRRYPSAEAVADDLGRWLRGEPTKARPLSRADRVRRALRRHPVWAAVAGLMLVATLAAAGVAAHLDPDRRRVAVEAEILEGGEVVLLGESGEPRWSRWRAGEPEARAGLDPVGTFFLSSTFDKRDVAFLELAPSVPRDRYRFEAEVRHDYTATAGHVGVYLAHRAVSPAKDALQVFALLSFDDIESALAVWNALARNLPHPLPPPPKGNAVSFDSHVYAEQPGTKRCSVGVSGLRKELFQPSGGDPGPKPWRKLTVEVTSHRVRVRWDGKWVGDIDPKKLIQNADDEMPGLMRSTPQLFAPNRVPPRMDFRGGLGLYVCRSSASFRNVTVGPLE